MGNKEGDRPDEGGRRRGRAKEDLGRARGGGQGGTDTRGVDRDWGEGGVREVVGATRLEVKSRRVGAPGPAAPEHEPLRVTGDGAPLCAGLGPLRAQRPRPPPRPPPAPPASRREAGVRGVVGVQQVGEVGRARVPPREAPRVALARVSEGERQRRRERAQAGAGAAGAGCGWEGRLRRRRDLVQAAPADRPLVGGSARGAGEAPGTLSSARGWARMVPAEAPRPAVRAPGGVLVARARVRRPAVDCGVGVRAGPARDGRPGGWGWGPAPEPDGECCRGPGPYNVLSRTNDNEPLSGTCNESREWPAGRVGRVSVLPAPGPSDPALHGPHPTGSHWWRKRRGPPVRGSPPWIRSYAPVLGGTTEPPSPLCNPKSYPRFLGGTKRIKLGEI